MPDRAESSRPSSTSLARLSCPVAFVFAGALLAFATSTAWPAALGLTVAALALLAVAALLDAARQLEADKLEAGFAGSLDNGAGAGQLVPCAVCHQRPALSTSPACALCLDVMRVDVSRAEVDQLARRRLARTLAAIAAATVGATSPARRRLP